MSFRTIDRGLAEQLRKDGNTYQEVARLLGCSVQWCKQNLSGIEKKRVCRCCGQEVVWEGDNV